MIQVTLNFVDVDAALLGLREIPRSLLVGELVAPQDNPPAETAPVAETKKEAPAKKEVAKPEPVATPATAETSAAPEPKAESSEPTPEDEYKVLQKAVFKLAAIDRQVAAAVVAEFGVKTFKELAQGQWPEALAAVKAKLAELGAA